jgi:hypothetical protein
MSDKGNQSLLANLFSKSDFAGSRHNDSSFEDNLLNASRGLDDLNPSTEPTSQMAQTTQSLKEYGKFSFSVVSCPVFVSTESQAKPIFR